MLVGFPVGGGADVAARTVGTRMSEALGQQVIVDNRPGAGSAIASEIAAKAPPDGHTLVSIGSSHAVNAALYPNLPYRPAADFSAVVLVATAPVAITANPAVPAKSLKELIALAKSRPGQLNYGAAGVNAEYRHRVPRMRRTPQRCTTGHVSVRVIPSTSCTCETTMRPSSSMDSASVRRITS